MSEGERGREETTYTPAAGCLPPDCRATLNVRLRPAGWLAYCTLLIDGDGCSTFGGHATYDIITHIHFDLE